MTEKREHVRLKIEAVHFRAKQNSVERYDKMAGYNVINWIGNKRLTYRISDFV